MNRKKVALVVTGGICLATWLAVGAGFAMGASKTTGIILVTAAALATEGLFWVGAIVLGISVVESRREVVGWLRLRLGI